MYPDAKDKQSGYAPRLPLISADAINYCWSTKTVVSSETAFCYGRFGVRQIGLRTNMSNAANLLSKYMVAMRPYTRLF